MSGHDFGGWSLPFERCDDLEVDTHGMIVDSVDVAAGSSDTPLGRLPVLVFTFRSSALPPEEQLPPLLFFAPASLLTEVAQLIGAAAANAIEAAGGGG